MAESPFPFLPHDKPIERPLQCTECRRPAKVLYTEVTQSGITHTLMCSECPFLEQKLHGGIKNETDGLAAGAGVSCGICGTTLEAIRTGSLLGCGECYEVFSEIIFNELVQSQAIPSRFVTLSKSMPLHLGRSSGKSQEVNISLKLIGLNEALRETLAKEDYEQAAMLRDQIKDLTDKQGKNESKQ